MALRQAAIAVFGHQVIDLRRGRPRAEVVTPTVEAALVGWLAGQVGVTPDAIASTVRRPR